MRHSSVDEVHFAHPGAYGVFAAFYLGQHAARNRAVRLEFRNRIKVERRKKRCRIVRIFKKPRDIRNEREFARFQRFCKRGGGDIRIDVVKMPVVYARPLSAGRGEPRNIC